MKRSTAFGFVIASLVSAPTFAENQEIWHGWADMPGIPCSTTETYRDFFGNTLPKFPPKTAPQEHHTRIYVDAPSEEDLLAIAKHCAVVAVGTSGAAAFYLSPASAWPAFKVAFDVCVREGGKTIAENLLSVVGKTECRW